MGRRVLIVGGGGREHALARKIAASPRVDKVFAAPGNAGIAAIADCVPIGADEVIRLRNLAQREAIDLTVVGPEAALVDGIVDRFERAGLRVFGPRAAAAHLEGSKVFAKDLMRRHGIPAASSRSFQNLELALEWVDRAPLPVVVKADGLAAGKGVSICRTTEEARLAVGRTMKDLAYGTAGESIVIEEFLVGEEVSILVLVDGENIYPLETTQDHKAARDGDEGPNTGGMGAFSPAPIVDEAMMNRIIKEILVPIVHAMNVEDRRFRGLLYAGLIITIEGPRVLEFNVRFGDPETQPLLARMKTDLLEVIEATIDGRLGEIEIEWDPRPSVCVVLASGGYPGPYETGRPIEGLAAIEGMADVEVFHAGTAHRGGRLVTDGGRVLGVTALGDTIESARQLAYEAAGRIRFEGMHLRTDIGQKAIAR
jgi:phosphoribosylamine--glycine ligase